MLNLMLAAVWFVFAVATLGLPLLNPDVKPWTLPGTQVSVGWLAVALCFYNIVRWWTMRASMREYPPLRTLPRRRDYDENEGEPGA